MRPHRKSQSAYAVTGMPVTMSNFVRISAVRPLIFYARMCTEQCRFRSYQNQGHLRDFEGVMTENSRLVEADFPYFVAIGHVRSCISCLILPFV